jgi:hypothetical protein
MVSRILWYRLAHEAVVLPAVEISELWESWPIRRTRFARSFSNGDGRQSNIDSAILASLGVRHCRINFR